MQALLELEMNSDLKAQLRELHITAAKVKTWVHSFWITIAIVQLQHSTINSCLN